MGLHGFATSKLPTTNARNTLSKFVADGVASNVVFGHTHRPSTTEGSSVGLNGVQSINSPCLRTCTDIDWIGLGFAEQWRLGFVVCYFKPNSRYFRHDMIIFEERGSKLVAYHNNKEYIS